MNWPSPFVLKRTLTVTLIAAAISISVSTGIRFVIGAEADMVTVIVRLVMPFVIAIPLGLVWFSKLERLEKSYRTLTKKANELARHASTDPLTGLLNRRSFAEKFDLAVSLDIKGVFLLADLDELKSINDRMGHLAGDDAIIAVGTALSTVLGEESLVGRIGGDEFCAFLPEWSDDIPERVNRLASEEFRSRTGVADVTVSASIGHATCRAGKKFRDMIALTDTRLYSRKRDRRLRR